MNKICHAIFIHMLQIYSNEKGKCHASLIFETAEKCPENLRLHVLIITFHMFICRLSAGAMMIDTI